MTVPAIAGHQYQYTDVRHQADTAVSGMWLFLVTETLLFGALFLAWIFCRHLQPDGFDAGGGMTDLGIGTTNTALLVSSSASYAVGLVCLNAGASRRFRWLAAVTIALGVGFLVLKGLEWREDFGKHLFPGSGFAVAGGIANGARLFFCFYFVATALHAVHMLCGVVLVAWIAARNPSECVSSHRLAAEVVGLYWSFVDIVWLILYPLIYLIGRGT